LERLNATKSVVTSLFAPAPTGPAAMLASPPSLTDVASSEFMPFSVMTSVTVSDTATPAWKPTLAAPTL
jgi:hypothetical protein